jgi:hypothetical protein
MAAAWGLFNNKKAPPASQADGARMVEALQLRGPVELGLLQNLRLRLDPVFQVVPMFGPARFEELVRTFLNSFPHCLVHDILSGRSVYVARYAHLVFFRHIDSFNWGWLRLLC